MSMCYLCDLCVHKSFEIEFNHIKTGDIKCGYGKGSIETPDDYTIDYGRDDPKEICEHFEPKEATR